MKARAIDRQTTRQRRYRIAPRRDPGRLRSPAEAGELHRKAAERVQGEPVVKDVGLTEGSGVEGY